MNEWINVGFSHHSEEGGTLGFPYPKAEDPLGQTSSPDWVRKQEVRR